MAGGFDRRGSLSFMTGSFDCRVARSFWPAVLIATPLSLPVAAHLIAALLIHIVAGAFDCRVAQASFGQHFWGSAVDC